MKKWLTGALLALACVAFAAAPPDRRDDGRPAGRCCLDDCPYRYDEGKNDRYARENERSDRKFYRSTCFSYRSTCCGGRYDRDDRRRGRRYARGGRGEIRCVWHPCHDDCRPGRCAYEHCRGYYEHICCDDTRRPADRPRRHRHHGCHD